MKLNYNFLNKNFICDYGSYGCDGCYGGSYGCAWTYCCGGSYGCDGECDDDGHPSLPQRQRVQDSQKIELPFQHQMKTFLY